MTEIVGGVGTSHVPAIGAAMDNGKTGETYWQPLFAGYEKAREWMAETRPDVALIVFNDHASAFSLDLIPTFTIGVGDEFKPADEGYGPRQVPVVRWIKQQSGGRTRLVQMNRPPGPKYFNLILSPPQYSVPIRENVVRLKWPLQLPPSAEALEPARSEWKDRLAEKMRIKGKIESYAAVDALKAEMMASVDEDQPDERAFAKRFWHEMQDMALREEVTQKGVRLDGRRFDEIRNLACEVGVLPRTHGSALFTRGETQALVTVTLGTSADAQRLDFVEGESKRRFPHRLSQPRPQRRHLRLWRRYQQPYTDPSPQYSADVGSCPPQHRPRRQYYHQPQRSL